MDGKQAVKRRERKVSSSRQRHGKPEPGIAVYVCSNVCTKQLNVMWPMAATGSTVLGSTVRSTIGLESTSGTSGCNLLFSRLMTASDYSVRLRVARWLICSDRLECQGA
ncbi:hypothetical protein MPTK1_4g12510 [Marchantia polymorpha subsp. ruderalis]|uniref:Uncharacterized protein n=2 Tax=Marchantia polymorpha TaxID=3197 RepID=A0AAF6B975_MARPO|nr:hypothetical protein MARPO_0174s0013 [Marchantia polymorpha]BBN08559.1 hypothetical protein Mp_4g12510 [Marchantia polymorpha subsp. ruderalis]|eukprot:PTQ28085.1 hypothetical protein MARPO_0174s0013 [Marchantia polymorpha]